MRKLLFLILLSNAIYAQDDAVEEIVVYSSLTNTTANKDASPLHIINSQRLTQNPSTSLGASINDLLGVSSSDFGAAVGQPIIRGLGGNRVNVLSNGLLIRDMSVLGPDHINEVETVNVAQIEIIRGPSALLYSNGSIGGILNIVDHSIATKNLNKRVLSIGSEYQEVNDGRKLDLIFMDNFADLNLSLSLSQGNFNDYSIPYGALMFEAHDDELEEDHAQEHDGEAITLLSNSDFFNETKKLGVSKVGDWGFIGLSYNTNQSIYGIPFHGQAEHGEAPLDGETEDPEVHEDEAQERTFTATKANTLVLRGHYLIDNRFFKNIDYAINNSDYRLTEQHLPSESEQLLTSTIEEPTDFTNKGTELRLKLDLNTDFMAQKIVISSEFYEEKIVGEEVFMPQVDSEALSIGYFLSKDFRGTALDVGIRFDRIKRQPEALDPYSDTVGSGSIAFSGYLSDNLDFNLGLSSVARIPESIELFANGPHLAIQRFELGNSTLVSERANNLDLSLRWSQGGYSAIVTLFQNRINNFIFLEDIYEEPEDEAQEAEDHEDQGHEHADLMEAEYSQMNAKFSGYEVELKRVFELKKAELEVSISRDVIRARFANGYNIPRSVPARSMLKLSYSDPSKWFINLSYQNVEKQTDTYPNETLTEGFDLLDITLGKTFKVANLEANLSLFGKNLLDEVARSHTSFVKEQVPLPGRNIGIKLKIGL